MEWLGSAVILICKNGCKFSKLVPFKYVWRLYVKKFWQSNLSFKPRYLERSVKVPRSPAIFLIYSLHCRGSWEYSRHLTSWWSSGDVFWGRSCLLMPLSLWWTLWISSQTFLYWILSLGTLHLLSGSDFRLYSLTFKVSTLCAIFSFFQSCVIKSCHVVPEFLSNHTGYN